MQVDRTARGVGVRGTPTPFSFPIGRNEKRDASFETSLFVLLRKPLDREQTVEERAVTPQRLPQVLGGDVALRPLLLEVRAFARKGLSQLLDRGRDQVVRR